MNEFKFLLEKNPIDHDLAHDHYIYEEFFFSIFFNIFFFFMNNSIFILKPSFMTVLKFTDFCQ